ncbi:hypothetical protein JCM24511_01331 [Saitozyma sp. JCM 24511]|nr:hypothetical protein JCM24511_01331 [Saitozyma sp. JCM 24511]
MMPQQYIQSPASSTSSAASTHSTSSRESTSTPPSSRSSSASQSPTRSSTGWRIALVTKDSRKGLHRNEVYMFPKDDDGDWSVNKAFKSVVHGLGDDIRRGTLGTHGNERFEFQVRTQEPHFCFLSQDISQAELSYNQRYLSDLTTAGDAPSATPVILRGSVSLTSRSSDFSSKFLRDETAVCWDKDPTMSQSGTMDAPPRSVTKDRVMPPPRPGPVRRTSSGKSVSWPDEELYDSSDAE